MNYTEAIEYIHSVNRTFCKPGLERVSALCEKLGNPQKNIRFVHVAGTNGKGSFCSMLNSVLSQAGYRVGLYTSPHMIRFNERMQVNGQCIADDVLADITTEVRPYVDTMEDRPTEFEVVTAIAFVYFARMNCDLVILETGLGGRLDATNIIEAPLASVITGIDLDHTAILGDTYEKIAYEKAGIMKENCPVVLGDCNEQAKGVLLEQAEKRGCPLSASDVSQIKNVSYSLDGTSFSYRSYKDLSLSLAGTYQPKNCATVIECVEVLRKSGIAITETQLRTGLNNTRWVGRFEILSKDPIVIYDGGHNPQGVSAFVDSFKKVLPNSKAVLVCGLLMDKDYEHMISAYSSVADAVFTLTVDSPRALSADALAQILSEKGIKATAYPTADEAVKAAFDYAMENNLALVMNGSLYMYSQVINTVKALIDEKL
jgi:dihydrofolate synthase/folylpolyglutamate synthase